MELKQYSIVWVNLDPTSGRDIQKTCPCVIISPNEMNQHLRTVIVAPMTHTSKTYPTRVAVRFNDQPCWVVLDQIRTIDRQRIIRIAGALTPLHIQKIKAVLREMLVE